MDIVTTIKTTSTVVSRKSAHGRSTLPVCQTGSFECSAFNHRAPMSCFQQFDASKQKIRNHHWLRSWVLMARKHSEWHHVTVSTVYTAHGAHRITYVHLCKDALCKYYTKGIVLHKVLTSDKHSTWGRLLKLHSKVASGWALISSKLWPYARNWAKSRGWALCLRLR